MQWLNNALRAIGGSAGSVAGVYNTIGQVLIARVY